MTPNPITRILVVRLGAMGDIIQALPAVASLKQSLPGARITWIVASRWAPLLDGNPTIDRSIPLDSMTPSSLLRARRELHSEPFDLAVDFQGLIKSALIAAAARPSRIFGFDRSQAREKPATLFYTHATLSTSSHVVDRNLDLAHDAGATSRTANFPLPPGEPDHALPDGDFVLACPLAGWGSKQWPLESYAALAKKLGMPLVVNGPPSSAGALSRIEGAVPHLSGIPGLIYATRRAAAIVGVDSGPLHLAAALGKPGVAIFGPTDPGRNGPYGNSIHVLRSPGAPTTYKRHAEIDASMRAVTPGDVLAALEAQLHRRESLHSA
jgi:heptosyltransferase-1